MEPLLAAKVSLGRLDADMAEQELYLLKLPRRLRDIDGHRFGEGRAEQCDPDHIRNMPPSPLPRSPSD